MSPRKFRVLCHPCGDDIDDDSSAYYFGIHADNDDKSDNDTIMTTMSFLAKTMTHLLLISACTMILCSSLLYFLSRTLAIVIVRMVIVKQH